MREYTLRCGQVSACDFAGNFRLLPIEQTKTVPMQLLTHRRRLFLVGGVFRLMCMALAGAGVWLSAPRAFGQFIYSESFTGTSAAGWIGVTDGSSPGPRLTADTAPDPADPEYGAPQIDAVGDGWLRLATTTTNQANAVTLDTAVRLHDVGRDGRGSGGRAFGFCL
jgi:hypothetical protein